MQIGSGAPNVVGPSRKENGEVRRSAEQIENRLQAGQDVSQEDWDRLADMFDDADEAPLESPARLSALEPPKDKLVGQRLRGLIRGALQDLADEDRKKT